MFVLLKHFRARAEIKSQIVHMRGGAYIVQKFNFIIKKIVFLI